LRAAIHPRTREASALMLQNMASPPFRNPQHAADYA
jgi:hypothetical protein